MKENIFNKPARVFLAFLVFGIIAALLVGFLTFKPCPHFSSSDNKFSLGKFSSEEELKNFIQERKSFFGRDYLSSISGIREFLSQMEVNLPTEEKSAAGAGEPERFSQTNIQVEGIDEPDIVKTDGKNIYFSSESYYRWIEPIPLLEKTLPEEKMSIIPPRWNYKTRIIKAFPPKQLEELTSIDKQGQLLLVDNFLIIFSGNKIYGYQVSDPQKPEKKWEISLRKRTYLVGARLYNKKLYLVTGTSIYDYNPCPIKPLEINNEVISVKCADIYYPQILFEPTVSYTSFIIDPQTGKRERNITFLGSRQGIIYMSKNNLYITYPSYQDVFSFMKNFILETGEDIFPPEIIEKVKKLDGYDISTQAKMTELEIILRRFKLSLDEDEALKVENELANRMEEYWKEHIRDLEKTAIVKISLRDFVIEAVGEVSGHILNQFSLDEDNGYFRVATTIGRFSFPYYFRFNTQREEKNDVYVLDEKLNIVGAIKDLGVGERIYSVRFLGNRGYVVTFKQIDPFFVIDLSDPKNPQVKGELKIPGYSSYLHPIEDNLILGIGREGSNVKISLFDVSDATNPQEISKYTLKEYWSEILNNHHAFLLDKKHKIFFIPAGRGGYIFDYSQKNLKLLKAIEIDNPKRAIYIDDYLYIIGEKELVVVDENIWERVNSLEYQD
ncbi:beta-propeller domain-containing protein [bacterium]|nr:beta-propeller domain-containing protein [bacterium]